MLANECLALFVHSVATTHAVHLILLMVNDLAVIAAVLLLGFALPRAGSWVGRWRRITCLSLAGSQLLMEVINAALPLVEGTAVWSQLLFAMTFISDLLQLALLICAGIYLTIVAARLGRKWLGVTAACGLAPSALMTMVADVFRVRFMSIIPTPSNIEHYMKVARIVSTCDSINGISLALVWTSIALFAAILALQKPR